MPAVKTKARFIEPMLLQRTEKLSQGEVWSYELKLDGFRTIAFKTAGRIHLRSRNNKDFNVRYPAIVQALVAMPDETVIDGEIKVALDEARPAASFQRTPEPRRCFADLLRLRHDDRRWKGRDERAAERAA